MKHSLETLEKWMLAVVRHREPGLDSILCTDAQAVMAVDAETLGDVVLPSKNLSSIERLDIYSNSYFARLYEILQRDYAVVEGIVGKKLFRAAIVEYLEKYPSQHYNLSHLGKFFPRYLRELPDDWPHRDVVAEVAAIERAVEEVFDEKRSTVVTPEEWAAFPADRWENARFTFVPAMRMLALEYPANRMMQNFLEKKPRRWPKAKKTRVVVYRKDWQAWRADLEAEEFEILRALHAGQTLGEAIETAMSTDGARPTKIARSIGHWFQKWTANGVFAAVR